MGRGRNKNAELVVVMLVALGAAACNRTKGQSDSMTPPPMPAATIDQGKFEALYRSGKAIEGALDSGVSQAALSEGLRSLATEIAIARDKPMRPDEAEMLKRFDEALASFVSSRKAWESAGAEEARRIWAFSLPRLRSATRLYLSDANGARDALREAEANEAAYHAEVSASAAASKAAAESARRSALDSAERARVFERDSAKAEAISWGLVNVDPERRLRACRELATLGAAAEKQIGQLEIHGLTDEDPRVVKAAREAIAAIRAKIPTKN